MKTYRVAKNVPIPEGRGRRKQYDFPVLEIGDSFLASSKSEVFAARKQYRNRGQDIVSRTQGKLGWRIWRTE